MSAEGNGAPTLHPRVVSIEGEMTIYRAAELKLGLLADLRGEGALHLDLSRVTELDSAGVQLLLLARHLADKEQKDLRLVSCSPSVTNVLELLNLKAHLGADGSSTEVPA